MRCGRLLGQRKQWRGFERRWGQILKDAQTPGLKEFHSCKFWARTKDGKRKGLYANWTDAKADKFLADLVECIRAFRLYPVVATLKVSAWKKLNKHERMLLTGGRYDESSSKWISPSAPNQTYYLPFQACILYPARTCKQHLKVHYAFDLNKQFKNHASDIFKLMKKDETYGFRDRLGALSLLPSEDAAGLQAADLLAYEMYQFGKVRGVEAVAQQPIHPRLRALLKHARSVHDFPFFDEAGIEPLLEEVPAYLRSSYSKQGV